MEKLTKFFMCYRNEEMLPNTLYSQESYPEKLGWNTNFIKIEQYSFPDFTNEYVIESDIMRVIAMACMQKNIFNNHILEMKEYENIIHTGNQLWDRESIHSSQKLQYF